jgi:hypothetical protein
MRRKKEEKGVDDNRDLSTWKTFAPPIAAAGRHYLKAGAWVGLQNCRIGGSVGLLVHKDCWTGGWLDNRHG